MLNSRTVAGEFIVKVCTGNLNFKRDPKENVSSTSILPPGIQLWQYDDNTFTLNILRLLRLVSGYEIDGVVLMKYKKKKKVTDVKQKDIKPGSIRFFAEILCQIVSCFLEQGT